ncbi:MAG: HAMP domain-containing protein, partial [Selenomonadaceae bacterium]|nr:HAMP domain-containing protein [Selenomonadaceae bacterium]
MIQILKAKKDFLIKLFKTKSLRRNVLFLSLSGVLLTFLIMIVTAPMFLYFIQSVITERGNQWSEHVADLTEKLYHGQTRMHLREKVAIHSDLINKNLVDIAEDAKNISAGMEEILKNKAQYLPRYLPDPRQEQVPLGKAYVLFNKRTLGKLPLDVMEELYQVSNVEDFMVAVTAEEYFDKFSDVTVVSAKDYVISMDYEPNATFVTMTEEYMDNLDYQMQSSWYKAVRETGKIFFTTPHYNEGNYFLHCGAPYYDADGNFAGGIGIGTEVNYLYNAVVDFDTDDPTIGIIVNQDGKIIMSSEKEGLFSVGDKDMRLNEDENLSAVFKKMTAMDHDVVSLTFSDTKYYVAFAPIKVANWSFGTIIENKTANAASDLAKGRILEQMDDFKSDLGQIFLLLMVFSLFSIVVMLAFLLRLGIRESDKFLKPIQNLIGGVQEISKGNFDRRLEVTTEDEIGTLANAVNTMAGELKTYMTDLTKVTAEKERISTELNVATNIQLSALPHDFLTERSEFEIFATMKAAK